MFDDFHPQGSDPEARRRLGGSIGAAVVMYGGLSVAVVAATATAREMVEEDLTQVEFVEQLPEPEPPPEPEPEPEPEVKQMRAAPKRPKLRTPKEISKEKLRESDDELAEADAPGPVDGSLDGVEGGQGTGRAAPPKPKRPKPTAPVASKRNRIPTYDSKTRRKGVEGVVVVSFVVTASGETSNVRIVSGPEALHALVRKAVARWRYKPATREGKPIPWKKTARIRFKLK
jgi:protein TonB